MAPVFVCRGEVVSSRFIYIILKYVVEYEVLTMVVMSVCFCEPIENPLKDER